MKNKLKPCPFCGAEYEGEKIPASGVVVCAHWDTGHFGVLCLNCGASSDWGETESAARRKWNRRVEKERMK